MTVYPSSVLDTLFTYQPPNDDTRPRHAAVAQARANLVYCGMSAVLRDDIPGALLWVLTGHTWTGKRDFLKPDVNTEGILWHLRTPAVAAVDGGWYLGLNAGQIGWLPKEAA